MKDTFATQVGRALFQLTKLNFDAEAGNPRLCRACYKKVIALKKAEDDVEAKKSELTKKIMSLASFFLLSRRDKGFPSPMQSSPDSRSPLAKRTRSNAENQMSTS